LQEAWNRNLGMIRKFVRKKYAFGKDAHLARAAPVHDLCHRFGKGLSVIALVLSGIDVLAIDFVLDGLGRILTIFSIQQVDERSPNLWIAEGDWVGGNGFNCLASNPGVF
jgi:hypothetical protein